MTTGQSAWRRIRRCFWVLLFATYSVAATAVMVDALRGDEYGQLTKVAETTIESPLHERREAAAQVAAVYRARSGVPLATLPPGSAFKIVWPDGSSEYVAVLDRGAEAGVLPIPGTQQAANGDEPTHELRLVPTEGGEAEEAIFQVR